MGAWPKLRSLVPPPKKSYLGLLCNFVLTSVTQTVDGTILSFSEDLHFLSQLVVKSNEMKFTEHFPSYSKTPYFKLTGEGHTNLGIRLNGAQAVRRRDVAVQVIRVRED